VKTEIVEQNAFLPLVFRYIVVGLINTAVHFLVTIFLVESEMLQPVPASVVGFTLALLVAFVLNRHWTFGRTDRPLQRLVKFTAVSLSGMVLNLLIMSAVVDWLHWHYLLGLCLVALIIPPYNFVLNFFWSFKPAEGNSS
jgi:putative flippase GtrA